MVNVAWLKALNTFSETEPPDFEETTAYEAWLEEQSDPCLRLGNEVKSMFGSVAEVDYRFALTRRRFPAPDPGTPEYSATVLGTSSAAALPWGWLTPGLGFSQRIRCGRVEPRDCHGLWSNYGIGYRRCC